VTQLDTCEVGSPAFVLTREVEAPAGRPGHAETRFAAADSPLVYQAATGGLVVYQVGGGMLCTGGRAAWLVLCRDPARAEGTGRRWLRSGLPLR
jgi:hypothetical protein